jgi:hypothetical protein
VKPENDDDPDLIMAVVEPLAAGLNRSFAASDAITSAVLSGLPLSRIRQALKMLLYSQYLEAAAAVAPQLQKMGTHAGMRVVAYLQVLSYSVANSPLLRICLASAVLPRYVSRNLSNLL